MTQAKTLVIEAIVSRGEKRILPRTNSVFHGSCHHFWLGFKKKNASRWWFSNHFLFTPKIGEDSPFWPIWFEIGWFNHQTWIFPTPTPFLPQQFFQSASLKFSRGSSLNYHTPKSLWPWLMRPGCPRNHKKGGPKTRYLCGGGTKSRWWVQQIFFDVHPGSLGKWYNLTNSFCSSGLKMLKPPSRNLSEFNL